MYKPDFQKYLTRHHAVLADHLLFASWLSKKRTRELTGLPIYTTNIEVLDGDFYFDMNWMKQVAHKYSQASLVPFFTFTKRGEIQGDKLKKLARSLVASEQTVALEKSFWVSVQAIQNMLIFVLITHPLALAAEKKVVALLKSKKVPKKELPSMLIQLATPSKLNGPGLEINDLYKIKRASKRPNFNLNRALEKHTDKYAYLGYRQAWSKGYTKKFFRDRLTSIKLPPKQQRPKLDLNKKEKELIKVVQEFVFVRNYRTERMYEAFYYVEPLWRSLAKKFKLTSTELGYYLLEEIEVLFDTGKCVPQETIKERKKGHGFLLHNGKLKLVVGKKLTKMQNKRKRSLKKSKEVKGTVACSGKTTGRAMVVLKPRDIKKVRAGDILITSMTTPDFLPAMHKAAGFVTDEGGITSHAAIVAREMQKPCVIGTKISTKIFKDGDMVEIDAEQGVIKKV
jgi:phosphohistidine swiveling domain-containing protein